MSCLETFVVFRGDSRIKWWFRSYRSEMLYSSAGTQRGHLEHHHPAFDERRFYTNNHCDRWRGYSISQCSSEFVCYRPYEFSTGCEQNPSPPPPTYTYTHTHTASPLFGLTVVILIQRVWQHLSGLQSQIVAKKKKKRFSSIHICTAVRLKE